MLVGVTVDDGVSVGVVVGVLVGWCLSHRTGFGRSVG